MNKDLTGKELVELEILANANNADVFFGEDEQAKIDQYHSAVKAAEEEQKKLFSSYYRYISVYDNIEDMQMWVEQGWCPACCSQRCEVEVDGKCEHGHPSVLLANHMI